MAIEVEFESDAYMSQREFALWVEGRQRWDPNHYELLNGRIVMNPPAGFPHGAIDSRLHRLIGPVVDAGHLGWTFGSSQGFDLPSGDTVEPDFSFVSNERWAQAHPEEGKFIDVAPDLVVEILSHSTRSRDRGEKKRIYEDNGVREYWLVDPRARTARIFHLRDGRYDTGMLFEFEDVLRSELLPGLEGPVADLFPT